MPPMSTTKPVAITTTVSGIRITAEKRLHDSAVSVITERTKDGQKMIIQTPFTEYSQGMEAYYRTVAGVRQLEDVAMARLKA